jgi:NAD(P)-dependent dehydrogenase (short-subunit alcohol dehydrogenase family)
MNQIRFGLRHPIRGLVSCAAISGESDACDYPASVFRQILDVNITGTFLIARAVADEMHRADVTGSIVLIASMSGHVSNRGINTSAYNASKAAVHQLARSLAAEWGHPQNTFPGSTATATNPNPSTEPRKVYPPIRVNTLSPGHISTPLSEAARVRGLTDEWANQNMLGRISQPEEYRAPVLFLLSEGSSYMTGAVSLTIIWLRGVDTNLNCRIFESMAGIALGSVVTIKIMSAAFTCVTGLELVTLKPPSRDETMAFRAASCKSTSHPVSTTLIKHTPNGHAEIEVFSVRSLRLMCGSFSCDTSRSPAPYGVP